MNYGFESKIIIVSYYKVRGWFDTLFLTKYFAI